MNVKWAIYRGLVANNLLKSFLMFSLIHRKLCLELIVLVCLYFSENKLEASYCIYNLLSRVNKEMIKYNSRNVVQNSFDNSCKSMFFDKIMIFQDYENRIFHSQDFIDTLCVLTHYFILCIKVMRMLLLVIQE